MTIDPISPLTVSNLKKLKNIVIGNPSAKKALASEEVVISRLVSCLDDHPVSSDPQGSQDNIRLEAANVIASVAYSAGDAIASLLRTDAPRALLLAMAHLGPEDSPVLQATFARALRTVTVAVADIVGPGSWGLKPDSSAIRSEARAALDFIFSGESLDVCLPLLAGRSSQACMAIAQLLGTGIRHDVHRQAVIDWLPPSERTQRMGSSRGWEKVAVTKTGPKQGWVIRALLHLLDIKDLKLLEYVLSGLASVTTPSTVYIVTQGGSSTLEHILSLSKSRSVDVQLAACQCAGAILRASNSANPHTSFDEAHVRILLYNLHRIISSSQSIPHQTKACFILNHLVNDEQRITRFAYEGGSLAKVVQLVQSITPVEEDSLLEEEEPENISELREAALTVIASMCLFDHEIRRVTTEEYRIFPIISASLKHRHVGVRYAACQCIRVLSRAVAILRTNIIDSGLGDAVFEIFKKPDEDRVVLHAALCAICNLVNDFSPSRPTYIGRGLVPRLAEITHMDDTQLRVTALWAIKNLLCKTSKATKEEVMDALSWPYLVKLLADPENDTREQAFNIVQNLAEDEAGTNMILAGLGPETLMDCLAASFKSSSEDVVLQGTRVLANLANGPPEHQDLILNHPEILASLRTILADSKGDIRAPAIGCIYELSRTSAQKRQVLVDAGMISTLRHICEWSSSPGGKLWPGVVAIDRDTVDEAKSALDYLEHGDRYGA